MSLLKSSKTNAGQLPKSVKVRTTCNACQQAKIRCSHEKPSCRRCQKHKIDCVYSVSRRLGRPAKKKESRSALGEQNGSSASEKMGQHVRERTRKATKKRCHGSKPTARPERPSKGAGKAFEGTIGDSDFQMPVLTERNLAVSSGLEIDLASENWLQGLFSTQISEAMGSVALDPSYDNPELEDSFGTFSGSFQCAGLTVNGHAADPYLSPITTVPESTAMPTTVDREPNAFHDSPHRELIAPPIITDASTAPFQATSASRDLQSLSDPWAVDRISSPGLLLDQLDPCSYFQSPEGSIESDLCSSEQPDIENKDKPSHSCSCYQQAFSKMVRAGLKTGQNGTSSIDSILACQKELYGQAEVILGCNVCSQSEAWANMLMVIIVTIDSLLTTLEETATSAKACLQDEMSSTEFPVGDRRQNDPSSSLRSHIDACPLTVGSFRVPVEEKACFIRQMLHARLSMLLLTIRRIRVCTKQLLASAPSRGRLMMIMETDRRLRLIMMKIRMVAG